MNDKVPATIPDEAPEVETIEATDLVPINDGATAPLVPKQFDPFSIMDRLDEDMLARELEGIAADELAYVVKDNTGKEQTGLSKVGVDECCNVLAQQGRAVREDDIQMKVMGEGKEREAFFTAKASLWVVSADGREVKLQSTTGLKRQPLYREGRTVKASDPVGFGKKHREHSWESVRENDPSYLKWIVANLTDKPDTMAFAQMLLDGEAIPPDGVQLSGGHNPFWFEAGGMKAMRNAKFRLIPSLVRAQVLATAKQAGRERVVDDRGQPTAQPEEKKMERGNLTATDEQLDEIRYMADSAYLSNDSRQTILEWLGGNNISREGASGAIAKLNVKIKKAKDVAAGAESKPDFPDVDAAEGEASDGQAP